MSFLWQDPETVQSVKAIRIRPPRRIGRRRKSPIVIDKKRMSLKPEQQINIEEQETEDIAQEFLGHVDDIARLLSEIRIKPASSYFDIDTKKLRNSFTVKNIPNINALEATIQSVKDMTQTHPEILLGQVDKVEDPMFKHEIQMEALLAVGVKDPERGEQLFIDFKKGPSDSINYSEEVVPYSYRNPLVEKMFAELPAERVLEYGLEKEMLKEGRELDWLTGWANKESLLNKDPERSLEIWKYAYTTFPDQVDDVGRLLMMMSHIAGLLLKIDPDRAYEVQKEALEHETKGPERLESFQKEVNEAKIDQLLAQDKFAQAWRIFKQKKEENALPSRSKMSMFSGSHFGQLAKAQVKRMLDYSKTLEIDQDPSPTFVKAAEMVNKLQDDFPSVSVLHEEVYEHARLRGIERAEKMRYDKAIILSPKEIFRDVKESLEPYQAIIAAAIVRDRPGQLFTPKEAFRAFRAVCDNPEQQILAAIMSPDSFAPHDELELEELDFLKKRLFELHYPEHNLQIYDNLDFYVQAIKESLSEDDLFKFLKVDVRGDTMRRKGNVEAYLDLAAGLDDMKEAEIRYRFIDRHPALVFSSYKSFPELEGDEEGREYVLEKTVKHRSIDDVVFEEETLSFFDSSFDDVVLRYIDKHAIDVWRFLDVEDLKGHELTQDAKDKLVNNMLQNKNYSKLFDAPQLPDFVQGAVFEPKLVSMAVCVIIEQKRKNRSDVNLENIELVTGSPIDYDAVGRAFVASNPDIASTMRFTSNSNKFDKGIPWAGMLRRLQKVQGMSKNEAHDPWRTDLEPLIAEMKDLNILDMHSKEDGEIVFKFISEFGMMNTPIIMHVFAESQRVSKTEEMSEEAKAHLSEFIGASRLAKLEKPKDVVNEIRQRKRKIVKDLLADGKVPKIFYTAIGQEIIQSTIGSTRWGRAEHSLGGLMRQWSKTRDRMPKDVGLPEGYQEEVVEVTQRDRSAESEVVDTSERVGRLVTKKWFLQGLEKSIDVFYALDVEVENVKEHLVSLAEDIVYNLMMKQERLKDRISKMQGEPPEGMTKNLDLLQTQIEKVRELWRTDLEGFPEDMTLIWGGLVDIMEKVNAIGLKGSSVDLFLKTLSALHIRQDDLNEALKVVTEDMARFVLNKQAPGESLSDVFDVSSFDQNTIFEMQQFTDGYLAEHYLHPNQESGHSCHEPFSKHLLWQLNRIWGFAAGRDKHPMAKAKRQVDAILDNKVLSDSTTPVAMVPGHGLMRIFSGDTGDACYTSQHKKLANAEFPSLHTVTFVTGRDTAHERFAGSVLFVETKSDAPSLKGRNDESVLLVRANNPRENLIQAVDDEELIGKTLEMAIETAKHRGLDMVVVPLDRAGGSCSNRAVVGNFYRKYFSTNPKVQLHNEPETNFNGYPNWDPAGNYPVVKIWDSSEGKIGGW